MASESWPRVRWIRKFVRADAEQPVGTALKILAEIRWNQWILLQWRQIQQDRFYPLKKTELAPRLQIANAEASVVQALGLQGKLSSKGVVTEEDETRELLPENGEQPWLNRRVLIDEKGTPLAIGALIVSREHEPLEYGRDTAEYMVGAQRSPRPTVQPESVNPREFSIIRVFYGTDRARTDQPAAYSNRRDPEGLLHLGICDVSIPRDHLLAKLESPRWWKFEFNWDPQKHVCVQDVRQLSEANFVMALRKDAMETQDQSAFVFVHGFNVGFEEAARRTAQLSYDLGFGGVPILYSWPSADSITGYLADEETIEWTRPHLLDFLSLIATSAGISKLHVIAHSMGNRALVKLLGGFLPECVSSLLNQIVLTAPDIDTGQFLQIAASIQGTANRTTLCASSNDKAIQLSRQAHQYPRAGESGPDIVIVDGVDTIDASSVDTSLLGHSYFGSKRTVLSDLYYLLRESKAPSERHSLEERKCSKGLYWAFRA